MSSRNKLRKLASDRAIWIRQVGIGVIGGHQDAKAAVQRLVKNQDQFAGLLAQSFGIENGRKFGSILRLQVRCFLDVLTAMKRNAPDFEPIQTCRTKSDDAAKFLHALMPSIKVETLGPALREEWNLGIDQVMSFRKGQHEKGVETFDKAMGHASVVADALAAALDERS